MTQTGDRDSFQTFMIMFMCCSNSQLTALTYLLKTNTRIQSPRGIALDPHEGLLFWTDWHTDRPRIESSDLSGDPKTRKIIFEVKNYKNGAWPNGLALDFLSKRIYWIDARANSIHSANYDGSDHREILRNVESLGHPFSIDIFESHVYWTDWRSQTIGKF